MMQSKVYHKGLILALFAVTAAAQAGFAGIRPGSAFSSDSLSLPGEVYTLDAEYLRRLNIDTFDDILQILPGVSSWREGPPGSATGYSVLGIRAALLVNGRLTDNIYTSEPLIRYVDAGRLRSVEVIYGGLFSMAGEIGPGLAVNLVVEQGGREPPFTQIDFTYGGNNRRARRVWFSTPRSYITAAISYNEYLQDAIESLDFGQNRLIGNNHMKSVSFEVTLGRDQEALMHFTRFEDTYSSTSCNRLEDIRTDGFDSWIEFSDELFRATLRHRGIDRKRISGRISGLGTELDLESGVSLGGAGLRAFFKGSNYIFENRFAGRNYDPAMHNYYGGLTVHSGPNSSYPLRTSLFLGQHSETDSYLGFEAGAARAGRNGSYQRISISRKVLLPSASELFHPAVRKSSPVDCYDIVPAGSNELFGQLTEEASIENRFRFGLSLKLFHRRVNDRIEPGDNSVMQNAGGVSKVSGAGMLFNRELGWRRFTLELGGGGEYYFERNGLEPGVPEYRAVGNAYLRFPLFKETEVITLHLNSIAFGERSWGGESAEQGVVHNFSFSMTLMSSTIRFQYKNILDTEYQTVPGYYMAGRHFRIGIIWNLPD